MKSEDYWETKRSEKLSHQEKNIDLMIDSLNNSSFFKSLKTQHLLQLAISLSKR